MLSLGLHCNNFHMCDLSLGLYCSNCHMCDLSLGLHCNNVHMCDLSLGLHCNNFHVCDLSLGLYCSNCHMCDLSLCLRCSNFHMCDLPVLMKHRYCAVMQHYRPDCSHINGSLRVSAAIILDVGLSDVFQMCNNNQGFSKWLLTHSLSPSIQRLSRFSLVSRLLIGWTATYIINV